MLSGCYADVYQCGASLAGNYGEGAPVGFLEVGGIFYGQYEDLLREALESQ